ncbi:MAG: hypothetical protein IJT69_02920 [Clostridia bacterium]|nr:hypothetical protein [Clostridia bacterium]
MKNKKTDFISVSIDLGADTTKVACAYRDVDGSYAYELLFNGGEGAPSMAYYDPDAQKWVFAKEEILRYAKKSFKYLVRIKDLLDLFYTRAEDGLYNGRIYKNYHYPPRANESYRGAIESGDCFEAMTTPRNVVALFVKYVLNKAKAEVRRKFGEVRIRYVVVYPANASMDYINELVSFVRESKEEDDDIYVISSARAVGVSAREFGIINKEKNVLIFNIGEDETSVVKVRFDDSNISAYAADGHNDSVRLGGRNIDVALACRLFELAGTVPSFGGIGGQAERGSYYDQYRMQEGIKIGKKMFPQWIASYPTEGYPFPMYREMVMTFKLDKDEFLKCCEPTFGRIWDYVAEELGRSENKGSVDAILFSGGAADTFGLDKHVEKRLKEKYKKVKFLDFSPANEQSGFDDVLCAAKDTVPIGAALFGAEKYDFKILTSFSYGTWTGRMGDFVGSRAPGKYRYMELLKKEVNIPLEGTPDFRRIVMGAKSYSGGPHVENGGWVVNNEYYSCDTDVFLEETRFDPNKSEFMIVLPPEYSLNSPTKKSAIRGEGYYRVNEKSKDAIPVGKIDLKRIGSGFKIVYELPLGCDKDFLYSLAVRIQRRKPPEEKVDLKDGAGSIDFYWSIVLGEIRMKEGFEFDFEGRPTPVVKNVSKEWFGDPKNYGKVYDPVYDKVILRIETNGNRVRF